jgi:hypothetical protein
LVCDFDPGRATSASTGPETVGADHSSDVSVCRLSPYGSNSGAEYVRNCIGCRISRF